MKYKRILLLTPLRNNISTDSSFCCEIEQDGQGALLGDVLEPLGVLQERRRRRRCREHRARLLREQRRAQGPYNEAGTKDTANKISAKESIDAIAAAYEGMKKDG